MAASAPVTSPPTRGRRPSLFQLRLWTGLVVGLFVIMHLGNHALGLGSLEAMEAARPWVMAFWKTPVGQLLLYGSLAGHAFLCLHSLGRRRHLRMARWEALQLALGLLMPAVLFGHIVHTRGTRLLTGIEITYPFELAHLRLVPVVGVLQTALVVVVGAHLAMGLHYAFRFRPGYRRLFPLILGLYVTVPFLALLGYTVAGSRVQREAAREPARFAALLARAVPADPAIARLHHALPVTSNVTWFSLVTLVLGVTVLRNRLARRHKVRVSFGDDDEILVPRGTTLLEASRLAGRPHMAVCGGRARCTTCRVRVQAGQDQLPEPEVAEAVTLERLGAPPGLRLACQVRPTHDVAVQILLDPKVAFAGRGQPRLAPGAGPGEFGQERWVTVLFADVRGSTRLAEHRLPYDVVFLMNELLAQMSAAIEATQGHYSNFTGDGLMALFGLEEAGGAERGRGARAALQCAADMLRRLERYNRRFASELDEPIQMGFGIHTGLAVVGWMGPPRTPVLTALGDTVNTAARLEGLTKELQAPIIASGATLAAAGGEVEGSALAGITMQEASLRGRATPLPVAALDRDTVVAALGGPTRPVLDDATPPPS